MKQFSIYPQLIKDISLVLLIALCLTAAAPSRASDRSNLQIVKECVDKHGGRQAITYKDAYVNFYLPGGTLKAYWRKPNMFKILYYDETSGKAKAASSVGDKTYGEEFDIKGYKIADFRRLVSSLGLDQLFAENTIRLQGRSYEHGQSRLTEVSQKDITGHQITSLIDEDKVLRGVRFVGPIESDYFVISMSQHQKMGKNFVSKRVEIKGPRLPALQMTLRRYAKDKLKNEDSFFSDPKEKPKLARRK